MLKTHSCGELRKDHVGQTVTLAGWVNKRRDMGGVIFIDLRDRGGKAQIVVNSSDAADAFTKAETVRGEYVLQAHHNTSTYTGLMAVIVEFTLQLKATY